MPHNTPSTLNGTCLAETVGDLLQWGKETLDVLGSRESLSSSELLLGEVLSCRRFDLYLNEDQEVPVEKKERFQFLIEQRSKRIPVAHLLKKAHFWNEELKVGKGCLIPRPETEVLVEKLIENTEIEKNQQFSFLDLGSGSGAIGVALLRTYPQAQATFADISEEALVYTRENLRRYDLMNRACVVHSDLFGSLENQKWNMIVSNPPYISSKEWSELEPEVLKDPRIALFGGEDGLVFYRFIIEQAGRYLEPNGILAFEVGKNQASAVKALLEAKQYHDIHIYPDYAGIDRVVVAKRTAVENLIYG